MPGENKVLRISAEADAQSFQGVRTMVRDLQAEAAKAAEALSQVARAAGGASAPMGVAGGTGGGPTAVPAGFRGAQVAAGAGGIASGLVAGVGGIAGVFRQAAEGARAAGRTIADSLRDAATQGEPHLRRMRESVQAVLDGMRQVGAARPPGGGGAGSGGGYDNAAPFRGIGPQLVPVGSPGPSFGTQAWREEAARRGDLLGMGPELKVVGQPDSRSFLQRLMGNAREGWGPAGGGGGGDEGGGGGGGGGGLLGALANIPGIGTLMSVARAAKGFGIAGGAAYLGYKAFDMGTRAFANVDVPNDEERINQEGYDLRYRAAAGRSFGGNAVGLMGGDLALTRAIQRTNQDPSFQRLMGRDMTETRVQLEAHRAGLPSVVNPLTGQSVTSSSGYTVSNLGKTIGQETGKAIVDLSRGATTSSTERLLTGLGSISSISGGVMLPSVAAAQTATSLVSPAKTQQDIQMKRAFAQLPIDQMAARQERIEQEKSSDPMFQYISSKLMSETFGNASMARGSGYGQAPIFDKKTGDFKGYSLDMFKSRLQRRNFTEGEGTAMNEAVSRTAGRGLMYHGESLLGAHAGGLYNAAELFGQGAQLGGGAPGSFLESVQRSVGAGGLDVTAGAELAGVFSSMAATGHGGIGAGGGFETLAASAALPGASPAEDLRNSRMAAGGLQQTAALFGGQVDPLGQALTRRAALRGAKGLGYNAADSLEHLLGNPAELAQIMSARGDVSEGLKGIGLSKANVQTALREQNLQNVVRTVRRGMTKGSAAEGFADKLVAQGGDVAETLRGIVGGELGDKGLARLQQLRGKGKLSSAERKESDALERRALKSYSRGMRGYAEVQAANEGWKHSADEVYQGLEFQAGLGGFGRKLRGGGAHDVLSKDAPERVTAEAISKLTGEESREKHRQLPEIRKAAGEVDLQAASEEEARRKAQVPRGAATDLVATQEHFGKALNASALALEKFAQRVEKAMARMPARGQ